MTTIECLDITAIPPANYHAIAVWATKTAAEKWAVAHSWSKRDVCAIKAGSRNMPFRQWILRDAAGFALTEAGFRSAEALATQEAAR